MSKRIAIAVLAAIASYLIGGFAGGGLVYMLSANPHDRSLEASMTGAFVLGPVAAVIGFFLALRRSRR